MTPTSAFHGGWQTAVQAIAPYSSLTRAGWTLIIPIAAAGLLRLLAERQLRRTLALVFQHAPDGSVIIIRNRGLGGAMCIQVGHRHIPRSWPRPAELT